MKQSSTRNFLILIKQRLTLTGLGLFLMVFLSACVSQSTTTKSTKIEPTVRKGPDLSEAAEQRLNLGLQYLQNGQVERAKHHLDKALQHAPNKASVQVGLAYYYEQVKEYSRAKGHYKKAIKLAPKNGDYLNLYGSFLCNQGDYTAAEKYFQKSVARTDYANVAATYENSGVCAKRAGNLTLAQDSFTKALDHNSNSSTSLLEMSDIWLQKNKYFKARAFLSRHLANTQVSAKSLWLGIQIEKVLGDDDALSSYALKLEGMFPTSEEAELYLNSKP